MARQRVHFLVRGAVLTYDSIHSLLISSEDDDPAVFAHGDDLWTAAHDTGAGSVVTRVIVSSGPLMTKRYCLKDKTIKRFQKSSIILTANKTDDFSCEYLIILVMAENGDCSGGGCSDDSVWIQKLQVN